MPEYYIGLMSGTSIDAIDAALVEFCNDGPRLTGYLSHPVSDEIKSRLHGLCRSGKHTELDEYSQMDVIMGRLFTDAVNCLLEYTRLKAGQITAIGSHGQTIYHNPEGDTPSSIQIGDPNIIAELTGITTVADFRRRDIAAGGQGAPLVPAFHQAIFQKTGENRVIVNIGGIANITVLPRQRETPVSGFDTGPGNTLLDQWAKRHLGQDMDRDAKFAQQGNSNTELVKLLLSDPYFSRPAPKSTGREYFNLAWLDQHIGEHHISPEDIQASLCELTANSIIKAIEIVAPETHRVLVCGGGAHNPVLMRLLQDNDANFIVESTMALDVEPDHVEAMAFAWLAYQTLHAYNSNITSVTGARSSTILGGIYPGKDTLQYLDR